MTARPFDPTAAAAARREDRPARAARPVGDDGLSGLCLGEASAAMRNIVLTGFMGTGKTTVGRVVAERLGRVFVDTDELIESRHGAIADIFEQLGEESFRDLERALARRLGERRGLVIATGGGMMLDERCAASLSPCSDAVCLTADAETVLARVGGPGASTRPLLACGDARARVLRLLEERASGYARFRAVKTDGLTPAEVAGAVIGALGAGA